MPRGHPTIGSRTGDVVAPAPASEILGTVHPRILDPQPERPSATWTGANGETISLDEGPPPWELEDGQHSLTDARMFVDVPNDWVLRWINPKLLDQCGWRYWRPVMRSDSRVKVKVSSMVSPEGNIRRGGQLGDILGYMPRHWVEARRKEHLMRTRQLTDSAVAQQERLREEFARGSFGPNIKLEDVKHPSNTMADGREMRTRGD